MSHTESSEPAKGDHRNGARDGLRVIEFFMHSGAPREPLAAERGGGTKRTGPARKDAP
ncbi:protein of unknown function [Methylorubrum extorquens]|uniref:Uncharacterized protein n=1 Tax=Methylorubrum extorquens TaxID=408 RepID=A0A2N9AIQ6_METEX|nr:protein of unknown function [Methylorubrum extorquens]